MPEPPHDGGERGRGRVGEVGAVGGDVPSPGAGAVGRTVQQPSTGSHRYSSSVSPSSRPSSRPRANVMRSNRREPRGNSSVPFERRLVQPRGSWTPTQRSGPTPSTSPRTSRPSPTPSPAVPRGRRRSSSSFPESVARVLDLGTGDGRTLALVLRERPGATGIGLDMSPPMLAAARQRYAGVDPVEWASTTSTTRCPTSAGSMSSFRGFAIHHTTDERKRALYGEVWDRLAPGGAFLNLEHVASPTAESSSASSPPWACGPTRRTGRTSCSTSRPRCGGCVESASPRSTATGSGVSWRSSGAASPSPVSAVAPVVGPAARPLSTTVRRPSAARQRWLG